MPYMVSKQRRDAARSGPVQDIPLHPLVKQVAREICPDETRWKILSPTSVLILNHPLPRRKEKKK